MPVITDSGRLAFRVVINGLRKRSVHGNFGELGFRSFIIQSYQIAVFKGVSLYRLYAFRNNDAVERTASYDYPTFYAFDAFAKNKLFQFSAKRKRIFVHMLHAARDRSFFQSAATLERPDAERKHAFGHRNFGKSAAIHKRVFTHRFHSRRNGQTVQRCTQHKRFLVYFFHARGEINFFEPSATRKRGVPYIFDVIAEHIDHEIHRNYRLYPSNYIALDALEGGRAFADKYTDEDKAVFDKYLAGQLAKIDLPGKDDDFLMERMLTMYANPARNYIKAQQ